jgi:hypothetical protein
VIVSIAKGPDGRPLRNWGVVPILATLIPLIDFLLPVGPPRPAFAPLLTSVAMLAVLFLIFHFGFRLPPKILSKVLVAGIVTFCVCALGYIAASFEYVGEEHSGESRSKRVVVGYELKPDLDREIKAEAEAALAERAREQDPLQNAASISKPPDDPGKAPRDADKITPFKTEEQIREERVDQLVARTSDPAAPYTESSQTIVAYGLFLLWECAFVSLAACIGILTVASRLVLRRGALAPKAR